MTLQQLSYFCVLADVLHFTRASEQLHVTQPSLSYSIAKLEKDLGVPLFRKTGKKLALTRYGEAFLPYARQALDTLEFGERKVELMRAPAKGSINLGYVYSVSYDFFPTLISNFMSIDGNREVTFQFTQGVKEDLLRRLSAGQIDLAIAGSYEAPGLQKATLMSQEIFLIMPKTNPLSGRERVTLSDLRGETFIFPKQSSGLREVLDRAFSEAGVIPHVAFEAEECNAMETFVATGAGMAFVPKMPHLSETVSVHHVSDPPLRRDIALLWMRKRVLPPLAERFKKFVLEQNWRDTEPKEYKTS